MDAPTAPAWSLETCPHRDCGGVFAIILAWRRERDRDGRSWHCPYCQRGIVVSQPIIPQLQRDLAAQRDEALVARDEARAARESEARCRRKLAAERAAKTRAQRQRDEARVPTRHPEEDETKLADMEEKG